MVEPSQEQRRECVEGGGRRGSEPIFEVAPETFAGVEFGRVRREKEQANVGRHVERASFVKSAIVKQEQMKISGRGSSEMLEEELKALSIEEGQFEKETFPRLRFHCPVQIHTLKAIGGGEHGLDAAGGDPVAHDRQKPATAFILRPHATARVTPLVGSVTCG